MQRMLRVSEETYNLVQVEAKRRKKPISQTADSLIIAGLERVYDEPAQKKIVAEARPLPKDEDLQAQIDAIAAKPSTIDEPDTLYAIVSGDDGRIHKEGLTYDEAEALLAKTPDPEGIFSIVATGQRKQR